MVKFWVDAIIAGKRAFHQTPAKLKDDVRVMLIEMGRQDLIDE